MFAALKASSLAGWIADSLTEEQRRPFYCETSRSSILAVAGSGKTKTLTHLLAHDLCRGIPAKSVIAFTFTEKAAQELQARIHTMSQEHLAGQDLSGMYIGTIHAWCFQYLSKRPAFYNTTAIDELHTDSLVARLYDRLDLKNVYGKSFPKGIRPFLTDLEVFYNENIAIAELPEAIRRPIDEFTALLAQNRLLTFGGMIRAAAEELTANGPDVEIRSLFVDEYQDVNEAQTKLIESMVGADTTLRVVGDDVQSIYNWRGSDVRKIIDFPETFAPSTTYRLRANFRSRRGIVNVANDVADRIVLRDATKKMVPARAPSSAPNVQWVSTQGELAQAAAIVEMVTRLRSRGVRLSDIGLLLRSVTGAGKPIYEALLAADIPVECPMYGAGTSFVRDFILPVLDWVRTPQEEPRNLEEEHEQEDAADELWAQVSSWVEGGDETSFWLAISDWCACVDEGKSAGYNVRRCLYQLLDAIGLRVGNGDEELAAGLAATSQVIRRVEEIHRRRLSDQPRRSARGVLTEAYYSVIRNYEEYTESLAPSGDLGRVTLTTVHQAKGLEWPVVCLPMLDRNRFPVREQPLYSSYPVETTRKYDTRLDDERRLFYVAVTRARERLFLIDTVDNRVKSRSAFLNELAESGLRPQSAMPEMDHDIWSIAEEDLVRPDGPPLRLGVSDLLAYLECPFQFHLRRVAGIEPSVGDELGYGQGLHELLQRRAQSETSWDRKFTADQAKLHVNMPLSSKGVEQNARKVIARHVATLAELGVFEAKSREEMPVEIGLRGGILTGIVDVVQDNADGSVTLLDWKANVHDQFVDRYTRQLQIYALALRSQGEAVATAEILDVAATAGAGKIVSISVNTSEADVAKLVDECEDALEGIAQGRFDPRPSPGACNACDMRLICKERLEEQDGRSGDEASH